MYFKNIALLEETTNCKEGMGTNVRCELTVPDPDVEIRGPRSFRPLDKRAGDPGPLGLSPRSATG